MQKDLIPQEKTKLRFHIVSAYASGSWQLDIHGKIDIHNEKRVFLESITPRIMLERFYEEHKVYGIDQAYIWDSENRKIVEYLTNLPGHEQKALMARRKVAEINKKMKQLQQLKENLFS